MRIFFRLLGWILVLAVIGNFAFAGHAAYLAFQGEAEWGLTVENYVASHMSAFDWTLGLARSHFPEGFANFILGLDLPAVIFFPIRAVVVAILANLCFKVAR